LNEEGALVICDFCDQMRAGECHLGLVAPKRMSCRSFDPQVASFCADPADFVSATQVVGMAIHFEIKGAELKKVKLMAAQEEEDRATAKRKTEPTPGTN
jgi:hypothetical protein